MREGTGCHLRADVENDLTCLSSKSFASLIFDDKYGEPPLSGWFASMTLRCASLILFFVRSLSLLCTHKVRIVSICFCMFHFMQAYLRPSIWLASRLSIRAWKPPMTHSWPFGALPNRLLAPAGPVCPAMRCIIGDSFAPFFAADLSPARMATPTPSTAAVPASMLAMAGWFGSLVEVVT